MREIDKISLEHAIRTRIRRLDIILDTGKHDSAYEQEQQHDESARLDNLNNTSMDSALMKIAEIERARLKDNLGWIDEGEAGICEECGCDIPIQRLLAVPTTRLCIKCAAGKS
jgi:RNA polymerase-binding transcription factor DksA